MTATDGESLLYLLGRLASVEQRARELVAARRRTDPEPDNRFRGLYLSDAHIDHLLDGGPDGARPAGPTGVTALADAAAHDGRDPDIRLARLTREAGLAPLDEELLLVALAPEVDPRLEQVYGYLNDDVSRRRASVGLALELAGLPMMIASARARLSAGGPLVDHGLVVVDDEDRPFLGRGLRVPDRVTAHLLGDDTVEKGLAAGLLPECPPVGEGAPLARALRAGVPVVYIRDHPGSVPRGLGGAAVAELGRPALHIDLAHAPVVEDWIELVVREAVLTGAVIVAGPVDAFGPTEQATMRAFTAVPRPLVLFGQRAWDPSWSAKVPLLVDAPIITREQRTALWDTVLSNGHALSNGVPSGPAFDAADVMAPFRLAPEQVARAARSANLSAEHDDAPLSPRHLRAGARAQNATGLDRLTRRIEPSYRWDDLVLPSATKAELADLTARARRRELVLDEWQMRRGGGRGRGVAALFAGDSGTGKTMSAEVIANELGLDLYTVDLSSVVDKYVGETEKNLERIFSEADGVNAVLLFDEADALFGRRSEVKDAHDRYANVEVAYLLQRMESFNGLAVLATNLKANLDEAFARRLDVIVDFPMPTEVERLALWDRCLGPLVPRSTDLDLGFCADSFELSGGNIHSIALSAAYLAAEAGTPIGMETVIRATHREYRKLGRLCVASEFGRWFDFVSQLDQPDSQTPGERQLTVG